MTDDILERAKASLEAFRQLIELLRQFQVIHPIPGAQFEGKPVLWPMSKVDESFLERAARFGATNPELAKKFLEEANKVLGEMKMNTSEPKTRKGHIFGRDLGQGLTKVEIDPETGLSMSWSSYVGTDGGGTRLLVRFHRKDIELAQSICTGPRENRR